ncbi:MAG: MFS transporter [Clostridia bacterium]|nr:MFS transporter [Clostridia bacterium]
MDKVYFKRNAVKIFLLCFIAYSVIYVGRKNFGACANAMIREGVIDEVISGTILAAFLIAYAIGQFVAGIIGDIVPPRIMISAGLLGAGLANILMGINSNPVLYIVIWCFCGASCSMLWAPLIYCISSWISEDNQKWAGVDIAVSIPAGTIISYFLCFILLKVSGWRMSFIVCGVVLVVTSALIFILLGRMKPYIAEMEEKSRQTIRKNAETEGKDFKKLSLLRVVLSFGLTFTVFGILSNGILKDGLESWIPTYISDLFNETESTASLISIMLPVVSLSGVFLATWVCRHFCGSNEMLASGYLFAGAGILMLVVLILTFFNSGNGETAGADGWSVVTMLITVFLISVVIAIMLGINNLYLTFIPLSFGKIGKASSVTGFLNSVSYGAAALSGVISGYLLKNVGWTAAIAMFTGAAAFGAAAGFSGSKTWGRVKERFSNGAENQASLQKTDSVQ